MVGGGTINYVDGVSAILNIYATRACLNISGLATIINLLLHTDHAQASKLSANRNQSLMIYIRNLVDFGLLSFTQMKICR